MAEEFTVFLKNKPGQLARVCDTLYQNGVNIESLSTEGTRENGTIKLVTNDVTTTKKALERARMPFDAKEVLVVEVLNRPGELAKITGKIGAADVNIESIYLFGNGRFAMRVNDMKKAKELLKEKIIS